MREGRLEMREGRGRRRGWNRESNGEENRKGQASGGVKAEEKWDGRQETGGGRQGEQERREKRSLSSPRDSVKAFCFTSDS